METIFQSRSDTAPMHYTLESIWFLLKHKDLGHNEYVTACQQNNIPAVSWAEKQDLKEWFDDPKKGTGSDPPMTKRTKHSNDKESLHNSTDNEDRLSTSSNTPSHKKSDSSEFSRSHKSSSTPSSIPHTSHPEKSQPPPEMTESGAVDAKTGEIILSKEKIQELKVKRSWVKKTSVSVEPQDPSFVDTLDELKPTDGVSDKHEKILKDIILREKPIRTPKTILQSNRKSFEKILGSVKEHIRKEKAKLDQEELQKKAQQRKKSKRTNL
jgi:hypothetical protein